MRAIPQMSADARVALEDLEHHRWLWEEHMVRGALPVRPAAALSPFTYLTVELTGAHLPAAVPVHCEVIVVQAQRTLLRIAGGWPDDLHVLAPPAPTASVAAAPAAAVAAVPVQRAPCPPTLEGDWLHFAAPGDLSAARQDLDTMGAVLARSTDTFPTHVERKVRVGIGGLQHGDALAAQLLPMGGGQVLCQFAEVRALRAALDAPGVPPRPSEERSTAASRAPHQAAPLRSAPLPARPTNPTPPATSDAPAPASAETPPPAAPPFLGCEELQFAAVPDIEAARKDLESVGAVMATTREPLHSRAERPLRLVVAGREVGEPIAAQLLPMGGGNVVCQFADLPGVRRLIAAALAPPLEAASGGSSTASARGDAPSKAWGLPLEGKLKNPTRVDALLDASLIRAPRPEELAAPSLLLLFRWLLGTRGAMQVEIEWEERASHPLYVIDGTSFRAPVEARTLARPFAFGEGRYRVTALSRVPTVTHKGRTAHLIPHLIRSWMLVHSVEALEAGLAPRLDQAPQLNEVGQALIDKLGLEGGNKRVAQNRLDGSFRLRDVLDTAAGNRIALETIYILLIGGGLTFLDQPVAGRASVAPAARQSEMSDAERTWRTMEHANYFTVLGLHWSVAPYEVPIAFHKLNQEWGPAGKRRAKADPAVADRIWARVLEAREVLGDGDKRRAYRKQSFQLQWSQQVALLLENAELASYRNDTQEAMRLLLAAEDVLPTPEGAALLKKLKRGKDLIDVVDDEEELAE